MDNTELKHWGVKGQKWGVRRYQNKDGTLTPAGQKRYNKEMEKLKAEEKVLKNKARTQAKLGKLDSKRQELDDLRKQVSGKKDEHDTNSSTPKTKPVKKSLKDMSDDELRATLNRIDMEKRYSDLTAPKEQKRVSKGKAFIADVLEKSGKNIATQFVTYAFGTAVNKAFSETFKDAQIVNPKKGQKDK